MPLKTIVVDLVPCAQIISVIYYNGLKSAIIIYHYDYYNNTPCPYQQAPLWLELGPSPWAPTVKGRLGQIMSVIENGMETL